MRPLDTRKRTLSAELAKDVAAWEAKGNEIPLVGPEANVGRWSVNSKKLGAEGNVESLRKQMRSERTVADDKRAGLDNVLPASKLA